MRQQKKDGENPLLLQEGGADNIQELLNEFVAAYVMLRAPIYNKSDKIQTIKDMITSSIRSSIKIKNDKWNDNVIQMQSWKLPKDICE